MTVLIISQHLDRMPPMTKKKPTTKLSDQLREFIENAPIGQNQIARESDLDRATLSRFLNKTGGLSVDGLDRIAGVLGLELVESKQSKAKKD